MILYDSIIQSIIVLHWCSIFPSLQPSAFCAGQPTLHRPDANALAGSGRQSLVSEPKKSGESHQLMDQIKSWRRLRFVWKITCFSHLDCLYGRKSRKYKPGSRSHTNYFYVDTETLWMCLKQHFRSKVWALARFGYQWKAWLLMSPGLVLHHYTPRIARDFFLESLYTPTTSNNWIQLAYSKSMRF